MIKRETGPEANSASQSNREQWKELVLSDCLVLP